MQDNTNLLLVGGLILVVGAIFLFKSKGPGPEKPGPNPDPGPVPPPPPSPFKPNPIKAKKAFISNLEDFSKLLLEAASITYRLLLTLNNRLNNMLDRIEPDDKRFVFKYKKNPIYTTIQKMDVRTFDSIAKKIPITCGSF